jgi:hypothetical protein
MTRPFVSDIGGIEREAEERPQEVIEMVPFQIPMPTYKALSDAAARKGMTVAQLLGKALTWAIEEG